MNIEHLLRELVGESEAVRLMNDQSSQDTFGGDPTWLEHLVAARNTLPLSKVPPVVSQDLNDIFDVNLRQQQHRAVVSVDSRAHQGATALGTSAWSMTFASEIAAIHFSLSPHGRTVDLDGRVLARGFQRVGFRARLSGQTTAATLCDANGQFRFTGLLRTVHQLVLTNRRFEIIMALDLGESGLGISGAAPKGGS